MSHIQDKSKSILICQFQIHLYSLFLSYCGGVCALILLFYSKVSMLLHEMLIRFIKSRSPLGITVTLGLIATFLDLLELHT